MKAYLKEAMCRMLDCQGWNATNETVEELAEGLVKEFKTNRWQPPPISEREDGFRCLAFHRGAWRDVVWAKAHEAWMFGYASPMIRDAGRVFAPLPPLPENAGDFWDNDYQCRR